MLSILIVAKPYEAELVRKACADLGHEARVPDATDHLGEWVERHQPNMLVLSTRLSRGDPRQILTEVRGTRHGGAIPVLLLGNGDEPGDLAVDQVLKRPVDLEQLVASISAATRPAGQGGVRPVAAMRRRIEGHYSLVEEGDYFSLLELGHAASTAEVEQAADRLLDEFDPQQLDAELAEEYAGQLAEIREVLAEARAVLAPDALREAYRAELEEAGGAEK